MLIEVYRAVPVRSVGTERERRHCQPSRSHAQPKPQARCGLTLVLPVGNVQVGLGVPVFLCQPEIDHVDLVASLADPHEEVVGLDVSVDKVARVNVLDSGDLAGREQAG